MLLRQRHLRVLPRQDRKYPELQAVISIPLRRVHRQQIIHRQQVHRDPEAFLRVAAAKRKTIRKVPVLV
jgi:hypothetical protein